MSTAGDPKSVAGTTWMKATPQKKVHPARCAVCGTERTVTTIREHFEAGWRYTNDSPQRSLCPEHA